MLNLPRLRRVYLIIHGLWGNALLSIVRRLYSALLDTALWLRGITLRCAALGRIAVRRAVPGLCRVALLGIGSWLCRSGICSLRLYRNGCAVYSLTEGFSKFLYRLLAVFLFDSHSLKQNLLHGGGYIGA